MSHCLAMNKKSSQIANNFSIKCIPCLIFHYLNKKMGGEISESQPLASPIPGLNAITNNQQAYSLLHRSVGALSWKDKSKGKHIGSGILISKNLVLTSAQNIYNKVYNSQNHKFKFHLGPNIYQIQDWKYPYAFTTTDQQEKLLTFNYAIVKLKENKEHPITFDSFLELTPPCQICLLESKDLNVEVYGFPQYNEVNLKVEQLRQYGVTKKGAITKVQLEKCNIEYDILTYPGQQGCPVIANSKIIAIHNGINTININLGVGRMITSEMIVAISNWSEQLGGSQFKVCNNNLCDYLKKSYEMTVENRWKSFALGFKNHHLQKLNIQIDNGYDDILRLQIIDLTSRDNCKLTQDSIVAFSKLTLNNLSQLRLDNNRIEDKGLEVLCQKDYPNLKVIELDDNAVTINGLRFILLNHWSNDVDYKLYSVYSNDDGYHLKVDQNIPLIKLIIKQDSQNLDELFANQGERKVLNAIKLLLITPLQGEIDDNVILQSKEIENKLKKESKNNGISLADLLLLLKEGYGDSLNFVKETNLKTQLTSKIMFNGSQNQRIKLAIKLDKFKQFNPQDFKDNHQKLKEFQRQFLMFLKMNYGVDTTDITIDKVTSHPFVVELSDSYKQIIKNQSFYAKIQIEVKRYFQNFQLSENQFDEEGNSSFPELSRAEIQERGGFPYYRPVIGKRFGIKVKDIYGNNNWIANNRNKDEWAVAFHGVSKPAKKNTLAEIMKGREKGKMLRTDGQRQSYQSYECINKVEKVGKGVYFSPYFLTCLFGYCEISVLQCRVRPDSIKITPKPDYWVINKSQDARPYGIILFKREQKTELQNILHPKNAVELHRYIYKDQFTKETWNNKYRAKFVQFINK